MNVASLENSKRLYELSGWFSTRDNYYLMDGIGSLRPAIKVGESWPGHQLVLDAPAYDSAYLLAKFDGVLHDITIPKDRLKDSADYLAELHIKSFTAEWRKVDSLPYEVNNLGEIRHEKTKRPRKLWTDKLGYIMFGYNAGKGKMRSLYVHTVVAQAFIPNLDDKPQVNHIDRNPSNNIVENLEWVTPQENIDHAILGGKFKSFGKPHSGKLSEKHGLFCTKHGLNHSQKYKSCTIKLFEQGIL